MDRITKQKIPIKIGPWMKCESPTQFHGPHYVPGIHVYASGEAIASRKNGPSSAKYPIGAILVKEKFDSMDSRTPSLVTVMEKTGNAGNVADWQFMMIELPERKIVTEGFRISCAACHSHFSETDFVSRETATLLTAYARR